MNIRKMLPRNIAVKLIPLKRFIFKNLFGYDYQADGLMATGHNMDFMQEPRFKEAWNFACSKNEKGWNGSVPDIRWRAHIAVWAAKHCSTLNGDFVECGVHTGILSHTICKYLNFGQLPHKFWLFDTFEGIPIDQLDDNEKVRGKYYNDSIYYDCYNDVKESFSEYSNVELVKGLIPDSFTGVAIDEVAFVSMDLNNANAEVAALEFLWDKMVPGGMIVFDDYGFMFHVGQKVAIDKFFAPYGIAVATLPTGQGLVVKA